MNDLSEFGMYNFSLPTLGILLGPWLGLLAITKTMKGELRYRLINDHTFKCHMHAYYHVAVQAWQKWQLKEVEEGRPVPTKPNIPCLYYCQYEFWCQKNAWHSPEGKCHVLHRRHVHTLLYRLARPFT